jgi:CheY-like chemotaxis protein
MDGIEATKLIREEGYVHPIVALTANILIGQEEMFLTNGFSGFISKPIDPNKLDECLKEFIVKKPPAEIAETYIEAPPPLPEEKPADVSEKLLALFLRDAIKAVKTLSEIMYSSNLNDEKIKLYTVTVHAMKSALANVGELELSDNAHALESASRTHDVEVISTETWPFLERLARVIEKLTPQDDSLDFPDEDPELLRQQLTFLCNACGEYNKKSARIILSALDDKTWSRRTKELLDEISVNILHSEFEAATENARKLLG